MPSQSPIQEALSIAHKWANITDTVLLKVMKARGIGITDDLYRSVRHKVYQKAGDMIGYDLSFLTYGRFRDMGVGRGTSLSVETTLGNREIIRNRGRRPGRWYARPFYGRLNALQGVLGHSLMEQAIQSVTKPLTDGD